MGLWPYGAGISQLLLLLLSEAGTLQASVSQGLIFVNLFVFSEQIFLLPGASSPCVSRSLTRPAVSSDMSRHVPHPFLASRVLPFGAGGWRLVAEL